MKLFTGTTLMAAALILTSFSTAPAVAAPQALGLVATYGDVELKCTGDECHADFTAFCLQQNRKSPDRGTNYFLANGEIRISGVTASGKMMDLNARSHLRIESRRRHLAVRLTIPRVTLNATTFERVTVNIKDGVVLLPETRVGDATPHAPQEVAALGHQMRSIGTSMVDANPDRMAAARILGDVINGLPERGKSNDGLRQKLWDDSIGRRGAASPAGAVDRARGIHRLCGWLAGRGTPNMRQCLENQHDVLIQFLNSEYWRAARPTI